MRHIENIGTIAELSTKRLKIYNNIIGLGLKVTRL